MFQLPRKFSYLLRCYSTVLLGKRGIIVHTLNVIYRFKGEKKEELQ